MLEKIFIEQAKHIRREYIKNSKEISKCENKIEIYKNDKTQRFRLKIGNACKMCGACVDACSYNALWW